MPGPALCGPLARAPLLPKLRGHFAEFLGNASPVGLGILSPSTCVGLRYGPAASHSGFSRQALRMLRYSFSLRVGRTLFAWGFSSMQRHALAPVFPFPAHALRPRPRSSVAAGYRNLHLLPIGCAPRPPLRTRLPQGRSALPWRPWIFGLEDSHLHLATHSGILPPPASTAPCDAASAAWGMLPYRAALAAPTASAACLSPGHFRRRDSRPVSCYALFECMAASEPTSWLSLNPHILSHLTRTLGPWPVVWALSLSTAQLISCSLTPAHRLRGIRSLIFFGRL